jgi:RNA polymerase sigma factor (sigma-70 family)
VKGPSIKGTENSNAMRLSAEYLVQQYQENLYLASFSICRNQQDAEDVVQDTFLKYLHTSKDFESEEHIKAWLIRVAVNKSKNILTTFWYRKKESLEDYMNSASFEEPGDQALAGAVLSLPKSYRIVIHLYYYEDYSVAEISQILAISESAVKNRLLRGRRLLQRKLKEDWTNDE